MTGCKNCDKPLHGPYCFACGQKYTPPVRLYLIVSLLFFLLILSYASLLAFSLEFVSRW